jgi:hypothetical protein
MQQTTRSPPFLKRPARSFPHAAAAEDTQRHEESRKETTELCSLASLLACVKKKHAHGAYIARETKFCVLKKGSEFEQN